MSEMELLTLTEAADKLKVSSKTLRRAINAGRLKCARLGKSSRSDRIHPDDLEQYVNHSRALRSECQSGNVVTFGGFPSRSADKELEHRLGKGLRRNRR